MSILALLGLALIAFGCLTLTVGVPDLAQYAFVPADNDADYLSKMSELGDELRDSGAVMTLYGIQNNVLISDRDEASAIPAALTAVSKEYFSVCPVRIVSGDLISSYSIEHHDRVIILDSRLALRLFGSDEPLGNTVRINGKSYTVIGTADYRRSYGDRADYAAWVPLGSGEGQPELMVVAATAGLDNGFLTLFEAACDKVLGPGTLISLPRERLRAYMPLYLIALVAAIWLLRGLYRLVIWCATRWFGQCRERLRAVYPRQAIMFIALRVAGFVLLIASVVASFWLIMRFFTHPVLVFVDWVPEVLVSWGAYRTRFWELLGAAATPVRHVTAEYTVVFFGAFLIRWGTILTLIGAVTTLIRHIRSKT